MTIGSYVIPSKLVEFRQRAPNGVISVLTGTPRTVIEAIREGRADFGISISDPQQDVSGLDVEAIGSDELVLVCKPGGKFDRPNLKPKQLERLPFIAAQGNTARREVEDFSALEDWRRPAKLRARVRPRRSDDARRTHRCRPRIFIQVIDR